MFGITLTLKVELNSEDYEGHEAEDRYLGLLSKTVVWPIVPRTGEYLFIQAMCEDGIYYNADTTVEYIFHDFGKPEIAIGCTLKYDDYIVFAADDSEWNRDDEF